MSMSMPRRVASTVALVALVSLIAVSFATATPDRHEPAPRQLELGLERLVDERLDWLEGRRVGLITNPTGTTRDLTHGIDVLIDAQEEGDFELTALYGPEHGVRGGAQAGEYVESYIDERTGLPVYSLYGETQKPTPEMLEDVDVLLFDIQDIGARFYTYIWTMYYAMEAAAEEGKEFIVLDRPNPLGDRMDGPILDPELSSFVGLREIPLQHGMTVGELAQLFNAEFLDDPVDLRVSTMRGYHPRMFEDGWDLHWVLPSPNIPTRETAWVYPGLGLIESINVSEGRGTTKPFLWFGAPWIEEADAYTLADDLNGRGLPGITFRPMFAQPTMSKHEGEFSGGLELHVDDAGTFEPVRTGLHVLDALFTHVDEVDWREEEDCRTPDDICWIDRLSGDVEVRQQLEADMDPDEIVAGWRTDLRLFRGMAAPHRLYPSTGRP